LGYLYKRGGVYWIQYFANGRRQRESTGTSKKLEAERVLRAREGRVALGQPVLPRVDRIKYEEIRADLERHYEAHGTRDLAEFRRRAVHLDRLFAGRRVAQIGPADVDAYVVARQAMGMKPGTVRRELSTLVTMLRLAYQRGKLLRLPTVHKPKDGPAREGFFEAEQYAAVRRHLPEDLRVATLIAYTLGWRMQSEILQLQRRHVDLEAGSIRLDPGMTKNDEGRIAYLTPELKAALTEQLERVKALEHRLGRIVPWVFPHRGKGKRAGQPRRDFRKAWAGACNKAGVPGRYRHDFRRTAVRNMERLGVPRSVATKDHRAQDRIRLPTLRDRIGCRLAGGGAAHDSHKKATIGGLDAATTVISVRQSSHGRIAQVEEHGPYKAGVAGSSPAPPTTNVSSFSGVSRQVQRQGGRPQKTAESPRITPRNGNAMATSVPIWTGPKHQDQCICPRTRCRRS